MPHVQKKGSKDMKVKRHNVSQRENQHDHIDQVTWNRKLQLLSVSAKTSFPSGTPTGGSKNDQRQS